MDITLVPALRRLTLTDVGCWKNLHLDFIPSLNVITGPGGCGKSTILLSIHQAVRDPRSIATGQIKIDFVSQPILGDVQAFTENRPERAVDESLGQFMLSQLVFYTRKAPRGMALLIEDVVTSSMDDLQYREAVGLLNRSSCQVICIIKRPFPLSDFPKGRVFTCYLDEKREANIRLSQAGE